MKILPEHLQHMRVAVEATLARYPDVVEQYETGNIPRADSVLDLQKRFCFDIMRASGLSSWVCDTLYPYMTDTHVYTALKAVCPKITRKY